MVFVGTSWSLDVDQVVGNCGLQMFGNKVEFFKEMIWFDGSGLFCFEDSRITKRFSWKCPLMMSFVWFWWCSNQWKVLFVLGRCSYQWNGFSMQWFACFVWWMHFSLKIDGHRSIMRMVIARDTHERCIQHIFVKLVPLFIIPPGGRGVLDLSLDNSSNDD